MEEREWRMVRWFRKMGCEAYKEETKDWYRRRASEYTGGKEQCHRCPAPSMAQ